MNFAFTEEQEKFREEIRDFCRTTPYGEIDANLLNFSPELNRKVAAKGWIGLILPKEYGGQGRSLTEGTILFEEMAAQRAPVRLHDGFRFGKIILKHGSEQQKRYCLPRIARGEMWLGQGFTEAGAGSDRLSITTRAVREGDHYIINGEKVFNGWAHEGPYLRQYGMSQHVLLLARTDPSAPSDKALSLFLFDATTPLPGMTYYPIIVPHQRTNEVFFDDMRIPAESLVGEENRGWDYLVENAGFYWSLGMGSQTAMMGALLQELVQYVKETQVDGQPLSKNALVRHKLAQLAIEIEESRFHTYRLAWAMDKGLDFRGLAAVAKFHGDRVAFHFSNAAMQILGPYGQLEAGAKYAPLGGAIETFYKFEVGATFNATGLNAMPNVIAGYILGLPNEFGWILG